MTTHTTKTRRLPRRRDAGAAAAALLLSGLAVLPTAAEEPPLSGSYVVVALRAASDAAATVEAREDSGGAEWLGAMLILDGLPIWYDGSGCAMPDMRAGEADAGAIADPNLSDLQVVPGGEDARQNVGMIVDCGGAARQSIHSLLVVDERVLVERTPNGTAYVILEKPLTEAEALALEEGLAAAGHDPGTVDGTIDAATRSAVAAYAAANGAAYTFGSGVITANVLAALTAG